MRPVPAEYATYFDRYISLVPGSDVLPLLSGQVAPFRAALTGLADDRAGFRYAPGKWSVRQVVGHLVDTERVFGFRALWIARGDTQPLPGFDQAPFAEMVQHDQYPLDELVDEFVSLRQSHVAMFRHLDAAAWERVGICSDHPLSVRACAYIMTGHLYYHASLLRDQYNISIDLGSLS